MGIDFIIEGIVVLLFVVLGKAGRSISKQSDEAARKRDREANKTDIGPVTGDYTSKTNGMRYDKDGCLKWRD